MNTYFIHDEQHFLNQYTLAATDQKDVALFLKIKGFRQIKRKEFVTLVRRRHEYAAIIGTGMNDSRNVSDIIADSINGTAEYFRTGDRISAGLR